MSDEQWLPVPEYEGLYEASDLGHVRSIKVKDLGSRRGRLLKAFPIGKYMGINLYDVTGKRRTVKLHRVIAATFIGPCPPGCEVLHGPGGRDDNRSSNLRYGTRKENIAEMIHRDGTYRPNPYPRGEDHPNARLTKALVVECRRRADAGESISSLARELGVSYGTAWQAVRRIGWGWVQLRRSPT